MGARPRPQATLLFRMIPRFSSTRSTRECATPITRACAGIGEQTHRTPGPTTLPLMMLASARGTNPPDPWTYHPQPQTYANVGCDGRSVVRSVYPTPDALTHHNLDAEPDRSRTGTRPNSNRTDLEPEPDRTRAGTRPNSNRTDLEPEPDRTRAGTRPISAQLRLTGRG